MKVLFQESQACSSVVSDIPTIIHELEEKESPATLVGLVCLKPSVSSFRKSLSLLDSM